MATFVKATFVLATFVHIRNISAVTGLIFLGPSLTDANCVGDLCTGKICPGDIYPYQEYFSCYWPNFDQTFWPLIFGPQFFWTQQIFGPKRFWSTTLTTRTTTKIKTKQHQSNWVGTSKQLNLVFYQNENVYKKQNLISLESTELWQL